MRRTLVLVCFSTWLLVSCSSSGGGGGEDTPGTGDTAGVTDAADVAVPPGDAGPDAGSPPSDGAGTETAAPDTADAADSGPGDEDARDVAPPPDVEPADVPDGVLPDVRPDAGPDTRADAGCATDEDCGSTGEACRRLACVEGRCVFVDVESSCEDGLVCTTGDHCEGGECVSGLPLDCDDGDSATECRCDPERGCVCDPRPVCGQGCSGGADCDDGDPCTTDACLTFETPTLCLCTPIPACSCDPTDPQADTSCDDGDDETTDTCEAVSDPSIPHAGLCRHEGPPPPPCAEPCTVDGDCGDADPCTEDACAPHPESGTCCAHEPYPRCGASCDEDSDCEDGDACTTVQCGAGGTCDPPVPDPGCECRPASVAEDCAGEDDDDPCTVMTCPAGRCVLETTSGPCDDDDACTRNDACVEGACEGDTIDCDDGEACTTDTCDPASGCVNTFVPGPGCVGCGGDAECDDGNPCTDDICRPDGACRNADLASGAQTSMCHEARCGVDVHCDDGNPCTVDSCEERTDGDGMPGTYCVSRRVEGCVPPPALACELDADCEFVACQPEGPNAPCAVLAGTIAAQTCAMPRCEPGTGCRFLRMGACPETAYFRCLPGDEEDACRDANACTVERCSDDWLTCEHDPAPLGEDNLFAECQGCDDLTPCPAFPDDPCVVVTCAPATWELPDLFPGIGICVARIDESRWPNRCEDYDVCTSNVCAEAGCANEPVAADCDGCSSDGACEDDDPCTADTCSGAPDLRCVNAPIPGCTRCERDTDCAGADEACPPQICAAGVCTPRSWGGVGGCVDLGCTSAMDCEDGDPATFAVCTSGGGCVYGPAPERIPCGSDRECFDVLDCLRTTGCAGGFCTFEDVPDCVQRTCSVNGDCDDGDPATDDWCIAGSCLSGRLRPDDGLRRCASVADCAAVVGPDGQPPCTTVTCEPDGHCGRRGLATSVTCAGRCTADADCAPACEGPDCDTFCLADGQCERWPCADPRCDLLSGGCVYLRGACPACVEDRDCVDPDPCTADTCVDGACVHAERDGCIPQACDDHTPCVPPDAAQVGLCLSGTCVFVPTP